ncbi:hypothetical protein GF357_03990 [Candidatus Dojkabacteria bacterium]|nr:hypothetical protein [Candidatus Dojkabacteria bacterium]
MKKRYVFFKTITTLLNPFILFGPVQFILYLVLPEYNEPLLVFLNIILQSVLPFALIGAFIQFKLVSDFEITKKSERPLYFSIVTIFFVLSGFISHAIPILQLIAFALALCLISIILINLVWKISGHLAFDVILFAGLACVDRVFGLLFFLLPVVAWSRVVLRKHSWKQTLGGVLLGVVCFCVVWFLLGFDGVFP